MNLNQNWYKIKSILELFYDGIIDILICIKQLPWMSYNPMSEKLRKFRNNKEVNTSQFDTSFGESVTRNSGKTGQSSNFYIFPTQKSLNSKERCQGSVGKANSINSRSNSNIRSAKTVDRSQYNETIDSLSKQLKNKDKELQDVIDEIVRRQKQHELDLQAVDRQYEDELARLHQIMFQEVKRNKELQDKANMIKAFGLDTSEDSSMLLADL